MTREGRKIVFIWVPGHVGIRGNSAGDSAAKDALDGDISVELIPFSDLKPRTNKYILELWQSEWDEFPENKLYKIFPVLKECIKYSFNTGNILYNFIYPWTNRKEETVMARLHIGHSFLTHSFLLKGEEPPTCIGCDKRLTIEHILLTCSDFIEIRESHFTAKSLCMLFKDISPKKIFNFFKERNIFGKTGPHSAVVSASDCRSEGLGFESHQSHVGFFGPGRLLPRAGSAMGPVGTLEPHSRASSTSRMRLWGCCSNYLTNTAGAAVPGPG